MLASTWGSLCFGKFQYTGRGSTEIYDGMSKLWSLSGYPR